MPGIHQPSLVSAMPRSVLEHSPSALPTTLHPSCCTGTSSIGAVNHLLHGVPQHPLLRPDVSKTVKAAYPARFCRQGRSTACQGAEEAPGAVARCSSRAPQPWPWWLCSGSVERRTRCALCRTSGAAPLPGPHGWIAARDETTSASSAFCVAVLWLLLFVNETSNVSTTVRNQCAGSRRWPTTVGYRGLNPVHHLVVDDLLHKTLQNLSWERTMTSTPVSPSGSTRPSPSPAADGVSQQPPVPPDCFMTEGAGGTSWRCV